MGLSFLTVLQQGTHKDGPDPGRHPAPLYRTKGSIPPALLESLRAPAAFIFKYQQGASESHTNTSSSHEAHADNVGPEEALLQQLHRAEITVRAMSYAKTAATDKNRSCDLGIAVLQL